MKKILLLSIFIFLSCSLIAQQDLGKHFTAHKTTFAEAGVSHTTLNVTDEHDNFWNQINNILGTPDREFINVKMWTNVTIDGLGSNLMLKITDAVMINDKATNTTIEKSFENEDEKASLLKQAGKNNNDRIMRITVYDNGGHNILNDETNQIIVAKYLDNIFK